MEKYEKMKSFDPEIYAAIQDETNRQNNKIELIASENFVSERIMEANGSPLTNKYAEGYPGKRYYGGCEHVDVVETLAIERAKELFGADYANVQAHSGAQANMAVFFALLTPGDTVLSMSLAHGGHLSHGSPVNMSGKYFNIVPYGVTEDTNTIDYDEVRRIALECKPKLILAGASAYPRIIDFKKFADIASEVGAYFMVDMAHIAGLVAAGCHPSPMPYADVVTTTTHKTLRGPRGGLILTNNEEIAVKINKAIFPGIQGGPLMHTIAAKAVCFKEALDPSFKTYAEQVVKNASVLADTLMAEGFKLVSGGPRGGLILTNNEEIAVKINKAIFPGIQGGPLMHTIAAKAVCFKEALDPSFKTYAEQVVKNASVLADTLMAEGFKLVSGGTDNHLMLVNLTDTGVTGKEAEKMLDEVGITVNKNAIPFDTKSPFVTSGIRIGTPASTSRGFKEEDMVEVGKLIAMTIKDFENNKEEVKTRVKALCDKYPLYR